MNQFFETASFHLVKPCNMKCKFCYATYDDIHVPGQLSLINAMDILNKLKEAGLQKITFAGGEPMLYKYIREVIIYAKQIGLTTSIITNGSLLTDKFLSEMKPWLDWIGISIDSLNVDTNNKIGRTWKNYTGGMINYQNLISRIKSREYKLKINTVVNRYNKTEDMNDFIQWAKPDRWKVFQTLRVEGQNDNNWDEIKCLPEEFYYFIRIHRTSKPVYEDNRLMTASYLLIDPLGRLFENSKGKHTYSSPIQDNTMEHCLSEVTLDREMFLERGGVYAW